MRDWINPKDCDLSKTGLMAITLVDIIRKRAQMENLNDKERCELVMKIIALLEPSLEVQVQVYMDVDGGDNYEGLLNFSKSNDIGITKGKEWIEYYDVKNLVDACIKKDKPEENQCVIYSEL